MPPVMSKPVETSASSRRQLQDNPVVVALADDNTLLAKRRIMENPGLATERINEDGDGDGDGTVMDLICGKGCATVKALFEEVAGDLHSLKDYKGRTLLHVAAGKDDVEVVRVIVDLCPNSIRELNNEAETPVHVAVKNGHVGCFWVLMEKLQQPQYINWIELLNHGDSKGNTVFHCAVLHKQIQILKALLSYKKRYGAHVVDVNSRNEMGLTARDLHPENTSILIDRCIHDILQKAGAKRGHEPLGRCEEMMQKMMQENMDFMKKSLLLALFIFTASAAYQSLFNLSNIDPHEHHVQVLNISVIDAIRSPSLLPDIFYVFAANSFAYLGSMCVILVNTWCMGSKCSLCYRAVPLFVTAAMLVSYGLAAKIIMPKFWITVGPNYKIPSFLAVWLLDIPLVFLLVATWHICKQFCHVTSAWL
ncbi:ankyrin repeat-containing protein At5g02620-like [Cornus florida]|uniref:ankyrin repeat-containing protein At5g02620-like n=1 Tax=Cornus florida TaxID=4283 RepID=UPI0028A069C3|nr:ankyrin repeat-containing protein At5g02620-like [Cornus florida]